MLYPPYKSETKPFTPGATLDLFDFVPENGPNGGRVVVDQFVVCVNGTITVAADTWDGRDVPRLLALVTVEQRDGRLRWNLSGYKSRIASIMFNGIERHTEHPTVGIGANQTIDLRHIVPMAKRKVVRGKDFALPSDAFKKITLTFASLASAATGGATVLSANALNVYVLAMWHEEMSVEFKCEDSVKSVDFTSANQARLSLNGLIHDLFIVREDPTVKGGGVITAITDARIEDLGTPVLTRGDLLFDYRNKHALGASLQAGGTFGTERYMEPVTNGNALPLISADDDTSAWSGKQLASLKIDTNGGILGNAAISREVLDKSQSNFNATVAKYGIDPRSVRMKTDGKTRRALGDGWSKREQLIGPWSAPLPKAG